MYFGNYGGQYVPEKLIKILDEVEAVFNTYCKTEEFNKTYKAYLKDFVGRPTSLYFAENLTKKLRRSKDLFKKGRFKPYRCS